MASRSDHILAGTLGAVARVWLKSFTCGPGRPSSHCEEKASHHRSLAGNFADSGASRFDHPAPSAIRIRRSAVGITPSLPANRDNSREVAWSATRISPAASAPGSARSTSCRLSSEPGFVDDPGFHHRVLFSGDTVSIGPELAERHSAPLRKSLPGERRKKRRFVTALFIAKEAEIICSAQPSYGHDY